MLGGGEESTLSGIIIKEYTVAVCSDLDHTLRMSAFGGKADAFQGAAECPLIAKSGHQPDNFSMIQATSNMVWFAGKY